MSLTNNNTITRLKNTDFFETIRHSKNYFSANIAIAGLSFISIPIFTRLFTRTDFGVVSVFITYVDIMTIVLALNAYTAVYRYYYEDHGDFDDFLGTTLVFVGVIFCLSAFLYLLFSKRIVGLIKLPGLLPIYLLGACLFNIMYSMYKQILVAQKRSRESAFISMSKEYTTLGISILFVCLLSNHRYLGRIWAILMVSFAFSFYFIMKLIKCSRFSFKWNHVKYIALFSFPLIPYHLSGIILAQFDRIMVNDIVSTAAAGLYSFGYTVGMLLHLVIASIHAAFVPDFFKFLNNGEHRRVEGLIGKLFSIIAVVALALVLFAKELVVILADKKFYPGLSVVPAVVIGYVFFGMFVFYNSYMTYWKKTFYISAVVLISGILNIALNAIYIPKYGYIAAAYTTVASFFFMFILTWTVLKSVIRQKIISLWLVGRPVLIMFAFMGAGHLLNYTNLNPVALFFIKLLGLVSFGMIVFYKELRSVFITGFA